MEKTAATKVRTCLTCERSVHLVTTQGKWDAHATRNDCVAVELPDGQMRLGETTSSYFLPGDCLPEDCLPEDCLPEEKVREARPDQADPH